MCMTDMRPDSIQVLEVGGEDSEDSEQETSGGFTDNNHQLPKKRLGVRHHETMGHMGQGPDAVTARLDLICAFAKDFEYEGVSRRDFQRSLIDQQGTLVRIQSYPIRHIPCSLMGQVGKSVEWPSNAKPFEATSSVGKFITSQMVRIERRLPGFPEVYTAMGTDSGVRASQKRKRQDQRQPTLLGCDDCPRGM